MTLAGDPDARSRGIRILVAGAGTLEALLVAQAHPQAREVVALDFSEKSLMISRRRALLARITGRRLPPLRCVSGSLEAEAPALQGSFDYILASNVLHHLHDPGTGLARLARWLAPGGLLRVVTYPRQSRVFMRETSRFLRAQGLDASQPDLIKRARKAISGLPPGAIRSCFESQPETCTRAGLIDAFFNARENPLAPLEWRSASRCCGLELVAESQRETSRSAFLRELLPATHVLSAWERLQVLDDLLELCANPVLWLRRTKASMTRPAARVEHVSKPLQGEIADGLLRARELLSRAEIKLSAALRALRTQVGPRVGAQGEPLPGLSVLDYVDEELEDEVLDEGALAAGAGAAELSLFWPPRL
jgi:SAM-dependent methyltransferase